MLHLVGFLSSRFTHDAQSQEHKACFQTFEEVHCNIEETEKLFNFKKSNYCFTQRGLNMSRKSARSKEEIKPNSKLIAGEKSSYTLGLHVHINGENITNKNLYL